MSRFSKSIRFAVAGLLALSVLAVSGSAQAAPEPAPEPSGSVVADGSGGVTVTFEGGPLVLTGLFILDAPATCPETLFDIFATYGFGLIESPTTVTVGTLVVSDLNTNVADTPLPAGTYQFCLLAFDAEASDTYLLSSLETTIGSVPTTTTTVAPTTTTTVAPTTTTSVASPAPAAPRFTG